MILDNLTVDTLDSESVSNIAQSDALDPLGGFNIPGMVTSESLNQQAVQGAEQTTEAGPGDPPAKKKPAGDESRKLYEQQKQLLGNWANTAATVAQTKRDPRLAAGRYEYDQYITNVDRYRGYGKSTFNKLGFNPLDDHQEEYYNQNTSWYQDYRRMGSHFFSMWGSSFVDNSTPVGAYNLFSSDEMEQSGIMDLKASENQARHMKLGSSSRGGVTEFTNNLLLNSAYSFGIISSVAAEELLIAGMTAITAPETGGGSAIAGGAATAKNLSKLGRLGQAWREGMALTQVGGITRGLGQMLKASGQMLTSLNKADAARTFWQGAKNFSNAYLNPLRGTTAALRGMSSATGALAHLNNAAKLSRGFGAFYRDIREFNFTLQEARLEGGGVYDRFVEQEINKIREQGREPSDSELQEIYSYAKAAGEIHGWTEIPIIFLTNRIVFDGLFKFRGVRNLTEAAEAANKSAVRGIGFDAATRTFSELPKVGLLGQLGRSIRNPRLYAGSFLNYTRANLAEGLQEIVQETSGDAIVKYYSNLYNNPENGNANYLSGSILSAVGDQIFSKQGVETFFSGFLMGGIMSGTTKAATGLLTRTGEAYMQVKNPEKFQQYLQQKSAVKTQMINSMNELMADPEKFFSPARESLVTQKRTTDNMVAADLNGDAKGFIDAKDDKTFDHVFTALNRGTFNMVIDGMKEVGKLSEEEIAQAFNLPEGTKAKEKVDEYVKRAEQIKNRYEYFQQNMPNPFKPGKFKKGSAEHIQEFISHKAFEDARKAAIASQYGFDRALERMNSLTSDLSQDRPLSSASASDFTVLLNEKTLNDEIKLLRQEVRSAGEELTADQKAIIKQKTKRLEALEDYRDKLKEHRKVRSGSKVTEEGQVELFQDSSTEEALEKSYKNYLKFIAKQNSDYLFDDKISESFRKVMDYYELDEDSKAYNDIVNKLLDPNNFQRHFERLYTTLNEMYDNRDNITESSIDKFLSVNELNSLMITLGQLGVIIDPEQIQDMVNTGRIPTTFLDMRTNQVIEQGDPRYETITEVIKSFKDIQDQSRPAEETAEQQTAETTEQAPATTAAPVQETEPAMELQPELRSKLQEAYADYIAMSGSDISFDEYINSDSPVVRFIKAQFESEQPAPAETTATEAASTTTEEKPLDLTASLAKVLTDERDKKLSDLLGLYSQAMKDPNPSGSEAAILADPVKYMEEGIENDEENLQKSEDKLKSLDAADPDNSQEIERLKGYIDRVKVVIEKSKAKLEEVKAVVDEYNDKMSRIGATPAAAAAPVSQVEQAPAITEDAPAAEKTALEKAQDLVDSVSSIRDLFDMNSDTAVELISEGVSSIDLRNMLQKRREELVKNISTKDLQKFDIVTLADGSKVVYVYTKNGKAHVKTSQDAKGEYTMMNEEEFLSKIRNVEPSKKVTMEPTETTPTPEVSEQDKKTVASSRDTMDSFVNDAARVKSTFDSIMNGTDESNAEDDLLNNLGCDT